MSLKITVGVLFCEGFPSANLSVNRCVYEASRGPVSLLAGDRAVSSSGPLSQEP